MAPTKVTRGGVENEYKASLTSVQKKQMKSKCNSKVPSTVIVERTPLVRKGLTKTKQTPDRNQTSPSSSSASSASPIFNPDYKAFSKTYVVDSLIGTGGYGNVHSALRRADNLQVAVKQIRVKDITEWTVDQVTGLRLPTEVFLLHKCRTVEGVIKLIEYFQSKTHALIVMERIPDYVDLFDYVSANGPLFQSNARFVVQQITQTLAQCQSLGVIHRDLKQENVLINDKTGKVKLIDFGLGVHVQNNNQKFNLFKGTAVYKPPEYFKNKETFADSLTVWSIGCFAYSVLFGDVPFENEVEIIAGVFKQSELNSIPKDCRDFILQTLKPKPKCRPLLQDLVNHPWISEDKPALRPRPQPKRANSYEVIEIGERPSNSDNSCASTCTSSHVDCEVIERDPRIYLKLRRV